MIAFAFMAGCLAADPISFFIGLFVARDRRVTHEPADLTDALAKKGRWQ